MVYLELIRDNGALVVYDYMPDSKEASCGTVAVNRFTRERILMNESSEDELASYRGHAAYCWFPET